MDLGQAVLATCGVAAVCIWYKRYHTVSIGDVPGPKNPSWIYGHRWWWLSEETGVVEKSLLEEYGTIVRWNGSLGEERLWVADTKAIHHILQGSSYLYEKPHITTARAALVMDFGVALVEGDVHKRQRRAMTPAFGLVEAKALYPCFVRCSNSLADKWHDTILNTGSEQTTIINVSSWLSKATLDAIGAGAFDYDFGALENAENKLTKSYMNLTFGAFGSPSKRAIFVMDALKWVPKGYGSWIYDINKSPGMVSLRENRAYAHEVASKLIEEKRQESKDGTSRKDLLSLLVKANSTQRPDWRLSEEEIIAQLRTIMFAGHETTGRTVSIPNFQTWDPFQGIPQLTCALWELAKNHHVQQRLRAEIMETLARIRAGGNNDFTANDFDSMPYLLAVGKETLRIYPIVTEILREPKKDDVLPLSEPVVGISGKVYSELHVPAGVNITISTVAYNMSKDLWGSDAYEFKPERWLDMDEKPELSIGVYSNLATFSGGPRSCLGWRFALIEMQTFLVTLLRKFDFSLPNNGQEVKKMRTIGITPIIVGEEHKGPQLPLKVTILGSEW